MKDLWPTRRTPTQQASALVNHTAATSASVARAAAGVSMANARSLLRFAVPALATAVFAGLYALHLFGHNALYSGILTRWGVAPFATPFLDTQFVLSSLECAHRGVDVYLHDPCDVLARPFNYSPVLLWAQALGLGVRDTQGAGLTIDGLFFFLMIPRPP